MGLTSDTRCGYDGWVNKTAPSLVALALLVPVTLSGCTMPTTAATVAKSTITAASVEKICAELPNVDQGDLEYCPQVVLTWLVRGEIAQQLAQDEQAPITDAEISSVETAMKGLEALTKNEITKPFGLAIEKFVIVNARSATGTDASSTDPTAKMSIMAAQYAPTINPRYGQWQPQLLGVSPKAGPQAVQYAVPAAKKS